MSVDNKALTRSSQSRAIRDPHHEAPPSELNCALLRRFRPYLDGEANQRVSGKAAGGKVAAEMAILSEFDQTLRTRVLRLISGPFVVENLIRLFLGLRERTYGREVVKEIGDFVAHAGDRSKGPATSWASDFLAIMRFQTVHVDSRDSATRFMKIYLDDLPSIFPRAMRANLNRMDKKWLYERLVIKPKPAAKILEAALGKFSAKGDRFAIAATLEKQEHELLTFLMFNLFSEELFDGETLFSQFVTVLQKNRLLMQDEITQIEKIKPLLALFAISSMHQCDLRLGDNITATLLGTIDGEGCLSVYALCELPFADGPAMKNFSLVFLTSLKAREHCTDALAPPGKSGSWLFPIELDSQTKLLRSLPGAAISFTNWELIVATRVPD